MQNLILLSPRKYYSTGNMTTMYLVRWNDHLVSYFPLIYHYGINTNILLLTFSRGEF